MQLGVQLFGFNFYKCKKWPEHKIRHKFKCNKAFPRIEACRQLDERLCGTNYLRFLKQFKDDPMGFQLLLGIQVPKDVWDACRGHHEDYRSWSWAKHFLIFWKYLISYFLGITLVPTSLWWDNGFRLLHVFIWKFATLSFISVVTRSTETRWTPPASLRGKPKISKLEKYNFGNQTCWYQIEDGPCLEICDFANWLRGQAPKLEKLIFLIFSNMGAV